MKLNLKQKLKNLLGEELPLTVGEALGNIILHVKSDPMRSFVLSQKLYTEMEYELSNVEYEFIRDAVKEHGRETYLNNLAPGQLLVILSELKQNA